LTIVCGSESNGLLTFIEHNACGFSGLTIIRLHAKRCCVHLIMSDVTATVRHFARQEVYTRALTQFQQTICHLIADNHHGDLYCGNGQKLSREIVAKNLLFHTGSIRGAYPRIIG